MYYALDFRVCVHPLETLVIYDSRLLNSQTVKIANDKHELEIKTDEENQIMHVIANLDRERKRVSGQVGKYGSGVEAKMSLCLALNSNFASW